MSQDQDPIDATRRFEPVDPYNIPPEHQFHGAPQQPQQAGFKQRLNRLSPLKLAVLGTAGVIVLGGAAWGTTAAFQSSGSSSNTAAAAPTTGQTPSQAGAGATTGGTGKHTRAGKLVRLKVTQVADGSFTGTEVKGGATVTVDYDARTRFGSKAHPVTSDRIQVGMTVAVIGARQGDTVTAVEIMIPAAKAPNAPATPGDTPTDPASPVGGNA